MLFSDASVDPGTGQVTLRGEFPNPKGELLPGMYVRVQIQQGTDGDALAVPQQAVQRNDTGGSEVYVVRPDNRAVIKPMRAGRVVDEQWLVLDGLDPGDRVVVEGFQKFEPGDIVDPVPWQPQSADGRRRCRQPESAVASAISTHADETGHGRASSSTARSSRR